MPIENPYDRRRPYPTRASENGMGRTPEPPQGAALTIEDVNRAMEAAYWRGRRAAMEAANAASAAERATAWEEGHEAGVQDGAHATYVKVRGIVEEYDAATPARAEVIKGLLAELAAVEPSDPDEIPF